MAWYIRYKPSKKKPREPYQFKNSRFGKVYGMKTLTPGPRRRAKTKPGKWIRLTI